MSTVSLRRAVAVAAVAVAGVLVCTSPAQAHTSLTGATPGKGDSVTSPAQVKLTFADPVRFPGLVVLDAAKHRFSGRPRAVDNTVTAQLTGVLPPGLYTVGWRVVAPDGHPVTGDYRFSVKATAGAAGSTPTVTTAGKPAEPSSDAGWWWVGLGVLVVAAAAGGFTVFRRRNG